MEKTLFILILTILFFSSMAKPKTSSKRISSESLTPEKEKLTHLHFYLHDIITSKKPTSIPITNPPINSSTLFGTIFMADDPLTVEPDINSKHLGKAQGLFGGASQTDVGFLMVLNLVFTEGNYNGSTLSLLGHNPIFSEVREMAIVGGTKSFRFARGYAQTRTHTFDPTTNNAIVEYNVYVLN